LSFFPKKYGKRFALEKTEDTRTTRKYSQTPTTATRLKNMSYSYQALKTKYAQCAISGFILRVQAVQFNKALFSSMILLSFAVGHLLPTAVPLWQQEWSCLELHAKLHSAFLERLLAALEQNPQHVLHRWPCQWQGAGTLHA